MRISPSSKALETAGVGGIELFSITLDPAMDTPGQLKKWAAQFEVGKGWSLLTGASADITKVLEACGAFVSDKTAHVPFVLIGSPRGTSGSGSRELPPPMKSSASPMLGFLERPADLAGAATGSAGPLAGAVAAPSTRRRMHSSRARKTGSGACSPPSQASSDRLFTRQRRAACACVSCSFRRVALSRPPAVRWFPY